ncbi:MAG: thiolase family protein [Dehalococcoidia bacterium]
MTEAVVIDALRTPFGRAGWRGVFRDITSIELSVAAINALLDRTKIDPNEVDHMVVGSVLLPSGFDRNLAIEADLPEQMGSNLTNRQCASSLEATAEAAGMIMTEQADVVMAVGAETDGRFDPVDPKTAGQRGDAWSVPEGTIRERANDRGELPEDWKNAELLPRFDEKVPDWIWNMGMTAEALSQRYGVGREDSDAYAFSSHKKAAAAIDAGKFQDHVIPIKIQYQDGTSPVVEQDQCVRPDTSLEKLATLKPAYKPDGLCTAGNSCPRNDGASAALLMSKEKAQELGYQPMATIRGWSGHGVDPRVMGIGPAPATEKLLKRMGMAITDFDLVELNEAFACQCVHLQRKMGIPEDRLNVNGGAVAIGHPYGATGIRLIAQLGHEMKRRDVEWGLATLCIGGGQGMSMAFQRGA